MKSLKGTKTEVNLLIAFAGESQARNRYTFYASQAKKEGYIEISQAFSTIANQEKEHAKRLFKFLEGGEVSISASYPAGVISNTYDNLIESMEGEHYENSQMYPDFADIAEQEGFTEIATCMRNIAVAEKYHEKIFSKFAEKVKSDAVFKRDTEVQWHCLNCGYTCTAKDAPKACPACLHKQEYFNVVH